MRFTRPSLWLAAPLLAVATLAAPAHADVKAGVEFWQKGDYQKAVAEWRPLAIAGDPDAQFNLGQAYKLGRGVPADLGQAESWYRRAAAQGHLQAEDNLGLVLFTANRRDDAMPYIARSAGRGEPRAQYVLGTAHFNGDLAARDWPRAYALTKRASDAGLSIASARLAQLDSLIPLDQRQAGLALLPEMERDEQRARLTAATAAVPPAPKPRPSTVRTAALPPSAPGTSYVPPPVIDPATPAPMPAPVSAAAPGTTYEAPEGLEELPPTVDIPPPAPTPVRIAAAPVRAVAPPPAAPPRPTSSAWRAQLGAFSVETRARALWTALEKKYPAMASRQPYLVKAGTLTRLQAGGFATKSEADAYCATVGSASQPCVVVSK